MAAEKSDETWPPIKPEERTLHEIFFYSQGPLDGYLFGEDAASLLLQSGLPPTVLSHIWTLADVTHDNALNVHEFVLATHLIRTALNGRPVPATLPRSLTPPSTAQLKLPPMLQQDRDAYHRLFQTLEVSGSGVVESDAMVEMFLTSRLPLATLALVWDLSDFGRDGRLSQEEFAIACHLLRFAMHGGSLNGPIDIFQYAPKFVSPVSLLARKRRVLEYEEQKQALMLVKEKRRMQAYREGRRLDLTKERLGCLQELFELLKQHDKEAEPLLPEAILQNKTQNEMQEEIVFRLKKAHEEARQETVKVILEEPKFSGDSAKVKKGADELNKILLFNRSHDNKEADPFQQLLEQRKEMNRDVTTEDLNKGNIYSPFKFSPFDVKVTPQSLPSGFKIMDGRNSNRKSEGVVEPVLADLTLFVEERLNEGSGATSPQNSLHGIPDDETFTEVSDRSADNWADFDKCLHGALPGLTDARVGQLTQKLSDLRQKLETLNSEGGRIIFRNSEDYSSRRKSVQQDNDEPARRRFGTEKLRSRSVGYPSTRDTTDCYNHSAAMKVRPGNEEISRDARARYKLQRQSSNFDSSPTGYPPTPSHKERKIMRSITDPMSILDKSSVSMEGIAAASVETGWPSSPQPQDDVSHFRDQTQPRASESNILNLRSSRRKDGLSLDLASIALGRAIQVETVPAPVSTNRTKQIDISPHDKLHDPHDKLHGPHDKLHCTNDKLHDTLDKLHGTNDKLQNETCVPFSSSPHSEKEQVKKDPSSPSIEDKTEKAAISNSPTTCLASDRAYSTSSVSSTSLTSNSNPIGAHNDSHGAHKPGREEQVQNWHASKSSNRDVHIKERITSTSILSEETTGNTNLMLQTPANTNDSQNHLEIGRPPQRPPRRNRRSIYSEISTEQSPLLSQLDSPVPLIPAKISQLNQINSRPLTTGATAPESTSHCQYQELKDKTEPMIHKENAGVTKNDNDGNQFSNELIEASKADLEHSNSHRNPHYNSNSNRGNQEPMTRYSELELNFLANETNHSQISEGKSQTVSSETHIEKTQRQIAKPRHRPSNFENLDTSTVKRMNTFPQLKGKVNNEIQQRNNIISNKDPNCENETVPPCLPVSSPPKLPMERPPEATEIHPQPERNHETMEYAVPYRIRSISQDVDQVGETIRHSNARESLKSSSNVPATLRESAVTSSKLPTAYPASDRQYHETNQRLLSNITSQRRSDYTSPSQDKSFTNHNRTDTPGIQDIPSNLKSHKRSDSGISVNSGISEITSVSYSGHGDAVLSPESAPASGKSSGSSNPGDYGFVYSADRPKPPPEVGWIDKQGDDQKISLYSENILKEGDTTEEVNRESIANLNTTKKQWEDIFTSNISNQGETLVRKKGAPKWEVKIPYTDKPSGISLNSDFQSVKTAGLETGDGDVEDPDMFKRQVNTESAIDREIRLAHEREDILRKDKENKIKQTEKQRGQGQAIIGSYEAESESFHQVYNELAEADRGSDLWSGEHGRLRTEGHDDNEDNKENPYPNESIIEKEIRLQRERESEVSRMRQKANTVSQNLQQPPQEKHLPSPVVHDPHDEVKEVKHNQPKSVANEDSIAKNSHEGESMIARELRELKEREEELKRLHNKLSRSDNTDQVDGSTSHTNSSSQKEKATSENSQRSSYLEAPSGHGIWNRDSSSNQRRESIDSNSSQGSGRAASDSTPSRRDVKVRPIVDDDDDDKKSDYFGKQETPIEREMRLTRERENELRRQKGLPDVDNKDENPYSSYGASPVPNNSSVVSKPRTVGQPGASMKKFATSRLQQEINQQKEREHELRSQGKVISTSEDRIEIKKYLEVAGVDRVDGTEKRNFVTRKASSPYSESDASLAQQEGGAAGAPASRKMTSIASSGNMFSYKEFKQTAESKIERELRELREREEELRLRRTQCQPESH